VTATEDSRLPLDAGDVERRLAELSVTWPVPVLKAQTGSTNDDLEALALAGAPEGTCVVAEEQVAGHGRVGRTWVSPAGAGLWMSVLVRAGDVSIDRWAWLSLAAGLAVRDALRSAAGVNAELKWPNDVMVPAVACGGSEGPRKLGGILSHVVGEDAVVIGIGVNVAMGSAELPVPQASSVLLEGGSLDRAALLAAVLAALRVRLDQWRSGDMALAADYREACISIGRMVEVAMPGGAHIRGIVSGIDHDGHLLVNDGENTQRVTAGDVVHATI
jgi:BirA family transcriptional regulator, biotin operon repressor / biotin---[acetyl-CoA-carboxylase] ligase